MDKCSTDAEFDSYWDNEAKNQNRNRIRVGRQYQATIPPLLKPGEKDGRKCEDLETLKWKPDQLSDQKLEEYMSMAKGISLFSKSVNNSRTTEKSDNSLQSAIKGLTEFVASHHPCHHDDGCRQVPKPSSPGESSSKISNTWSPSEAQIFLQALEVCGKNFSAIKKEFLPWKPVRSIIEYYYQNKNEKIEEKKEFIDKLILKEEEEPTPSCSYEQKPSVKEEPLQSENSTQENINAEDPPKDTINFLDHSRVTDPCSAISETVLSKDDKVSPSTVGSLKFFLGGRLVLKLNAQQDGGSGNKCQWVQSNDLPKYSNLNKKDKNKKKFIPHGYSSPSGAQKTFKKEDVSSIPNNLQDCDPTGTKKPKLKTEYDLAESSPKNLLCSSSWTPPVADGQESIEVDDGSSKTSEGYISPVLSVNSRTSKTDAMRLDLTCNPNSLIEVSEQKCDSDSMWAKTENCNVNDSASKNVSILSGKNSPIMSYSSPLKKEVLNHKSALSHSRPCVKSPCYQSRSSHSNPMLKQRNKWSNIPYPLKSSPSSSPVYIEMRTCTKETALDLSSKSDSGSNSTDNHIKQTNISEIIDCSENILCESDSRPDSAFSPQSSNVGMHSQCGESPKKESCSACNCCEGVSTETFDNSLLKEANDFLASKESDDSSHITYSYCNLPYQCALPKCTKDYTIEEHMCNKNNDRKNQANSPEYIIDDGMCDKNSDCCSKSMSSYYPYYSHCYPYYVSYGITTQNSADTESSEAPLDLSSTNENNTEKLPNSEKVSENSNDESSQNAEAGGRGMLYQLLKNKSK